MCKNTNYNLIAKFFQTKTKVLVKHFSFSILNIMTIHMKKHSTRIVCSMVMLIVSHFYLTGQNETSFVNSLKNNETTAMEVYLEDKIDFCIFEDQQIMLKKAAMLKLKDFLNSYKIVNAEIIHKGTSKDKSSQYKVVKITTNKETFRMFIYASGEIGAKTIKEIRIDKF